jgi:hypothetical protein
MTPYLPTITRLGIREVEAGNRAQSDDRYGLTLVLMGSSHGETEPTKATYQGAGHSVQHPDIESVGDRSLIAETDIQEFVSRYLNAVRHEEGKLFILTVS